MVAQAGIEPATHGFSVRLDSNRLKGLLWFYNYNLISYIYIHMGTPIQKYIYLFASIIACSFALSSCDNHTSREKHTFETNDGAFQILINSYDIFEDVTNNTIGARYDWAHLLRFTYAAKNISNGRQHVPVIVPILYKELADNKIEYYNNHNCSYYGFYDTIISDYSIQPTLGFKHSSSFVPVTSFAPNETISYNHELFISAETNDRLDGGYTLGFLSTPNYDSTNKVFNKNITDSKKIAYIEEHLIYSFSFDISTIYSF